MFNVYRKLISGYHAVLMIKHTTHTHTHNGQCVSRVCGHQSRSSSLKLTVAATKNKIKQTYRLYLLPNYRSRSSSQRAEEPVINVEAEERISPILMYFINI